MAVIISKKAAQVLKKAEIRREIREEQLNGPKPKDRDPTDVIEPINISPDISLLKALWVLKGRPGRTLMMVRRKDGKAYYVKDYNPVTRELTLGMDEYSRTTGEMFIFTSKMTQKVEYDYAPLWR